VVALEGVDPMRFQSIGVLVFASVVAALAVMAACGPTAPQAMPPPIPVASTPNLTPTPVLAAGEYVLDEAHKTPEKDQPCPT
jgi:hypothetical protein